ncbi:GumC family protein, partial [Singulisphaera rosea]
MSTLPEPVGGPLGGPLYPKNGRFPGELEIDLEDGQKPKQEKFSPQLIWRAFRRHWWQVLAAWAVGSVGIVYMANQRIKTAYDVTARVRVEPGDQPLHVNKSIMGGSDLAEFREVQISTVTSPVVLNLALSDHPELYRFGRLQNTDDAEGALRGSIKVAPVIKTPLIEISMTSNSPDEAVGIVNAVVDAYLKNAASITSDETKQRIEQLRKGEEDYTRELEEKRRESVRLSEQFGAADIEGAKDSNSITSEDYRMLSDQLAKVEVERVTLEAELEHYRRQKLTPPPTAVDNGQLNEAVEDALKSHPSIQDIQSQIDRIVTQLEHMGRTARTRSDPAGMALQRKLIAFRKQLAAKRTELRPKLARQLRPPVVEEGEDEAVNSSEARLAAIKVHEEYLRDKLKVMKVRTQKAGSEAMRLQFANFDTNRAAEVLHKVQDSLHQLEHESRNPLARVRLEYPARMPKRPNPNSKGRVIMMGPIAVFGMVLGLFVLLERRSARVANPEDLPGRARLQVLG